MAAGGTTGGSVGFDSVGESAVDGAACGFGACVAGAVETTLVTVEATFDAEVPVVTLAAVVDGVSEVPTGAERAWSATVGTRLAGAGRTLAEALPRNSKSRSIDPSVPTTARITQRRTILPPMHEKYAPVLLG